MNVESFPTKLARHAAAERAVAEQRELIGASERMEHRSLDFTFNDGIAALSRAIRRSPNDSPIRPTLQSYHEHLESLVANERGGSGLGPESKLSDRGPISIGSRSPVAFAALRCVAEFHRTQGSTPLLRASGERIIDAQDRRLAEDFREDTLHRVMRENFLRPPEQRLAAAREAQLLARRGEALLHAYDPANPDRFAREAAMLVDRVFAFRIRYGTPYRSPIKIEGERAMLEMEEKIADIAGAGVIRKLTASLPVELLRARGRHQDDPPELAAQLKRENDERRARLDFFCAPTLPKLAAYTKLLEEFVVSAVHTGATRDVARVSCMLDPESFTFGVVMTAIEARATVDAQKAAERLAIAAEFEALPAPSAPARSNKKKHRRAVVAQPADDRRTQTKSQSSAVQPTAASSSVAGSLRERIAAAARSKYEPAALEGNVAKTILDNLSTFPQVVGFNETIARDSGGTLGEIDVHLDNAIVECTLRSSGKDAQLRKYLNDPKMNPQRKAVVLYGENYRERVPHGVVVVRSCEELADTLFALKADEYGWAKRSGA